MTWKNESCLFGSMIWGGNFKGYPAVVGSYHGGASLYIFRNDKWETYAKADRSNRVVPYFCKNCDTELPVRNVDIQNE